MNSIAEGFFGLIKKFKDRIWKSQHFKIKFVLVGLVALLALIFPNLYQEDIETEFRIEADTSPWIHSINITPSIPDRTASLNASCIPRDNETLTITVNFTWWRMSNSTWEHVTIYDSLVTCANNTICYPSVLVPSSATEFGYDFRCMATANASDTIGTPKNSTVEEIRWYINKYTEMPYQAQFNCSDTEGVGCLIANASGVTLDCNHSSIRWGSGSAKALYLNHINNSIFRNCIINFTTLVNSVGMSIWNSHNNEFANFTIVNMKYGAVYMDNSSNNTLKDSYIKTKDDLAIELGTLTGSVNSPAPNNKFYNLTIVGTAGDIGGISTWTGTEIIAVSIHYVDMCIGLAGHNVSIKSVNLTNCTTAGIDASWQTSYGHEIIDSTIGSAPAGSTDLEFWEATEIMLLNTTYSSVDYHSTATNLTRKWYLDAQVNMSDNNPLSSALVTCFNVSDLQIFSETTDSDGRLRQNVTQYRTFSNVTTSEMNLTCNISKHGFTKYTNNFNLSTNRQENATLTPIHVNLLSIAGNSNNSFSFTNSLPYVEFNVSSSKSNYLCTFCLNSACSFGTNSSVQNNTNTRITANESLSLDWNEIFINCSETNGGFNESETWLYRYGINVATPQPNSFFWDRTPNLKFSVDYVDPTNWTYQETANATGSGGDWNNVANIYDGDWNTYGDATAPSDLGQAFFNYSKPPTATNSSLWQVKGGNGIVNLTINQSCWEETKLRLAVQSQSPDVTVSWWCHNGANWIQMSEGSITDNVYEEAMWWYVPNATAGGNVSDKCYVSINGGSNISLMYVTSEAYDNDSFYTEPLTVGERNLTITCDSLSNLSAKRTIYVNQIRIYNQNISSSSTYCNSFIFPAGGGINDTYYMELPCSSFNVSLDINITGYESDGNWSANLSLDSVFDLSWSGNFSSTNWTSLGNLIETNLSGSTSTCKYYLNFSADSAGNITFCITANHSFQTKHFNPLAELSGGIPYFYFFPNQRDSKNVSAHGQNSTLPVINITNTNTSICDLMLKTNASIPGIDLKCSNNSHVSNAINLTSSYLPVLRNMIVDNITAIWCWADYYNPAALPKSYEIWIDAWSWD